MENQFIGQYHISYNPWPVYTRFINRRQYEITDHLGSTRVIVNNRALVTFSEEDGSVTYACADVLSLLNYYPGGQLQPGMTWENTNYRYGYNTQERSDEIYGPGNFYTAQFWEYDSRIWRRWNRDLVSFADMSVYAVFFNNPIFFIDPLGAEGEGNDGVFRPGSGPQALPTMLPEVNVFADRMPSPPLMGAATSGMSMGPSFEFMRFVAAPMPVTAPLTGVSNLQLNEQPQKEDNAQLKEPNFIPLWVNWTNNVATVAAFQATQVGGSMRFTKGGSISLKHYASGWTGGSRARITTYNLSKLGTHIGYGTSALGFGFGLYNFSVSDKSWGDVGSLGVSLTSSSLTLSGVTAPVGIAIGLIDVSGGFNGFYNYLDSQEQFYKITGGVRLPVNGVPVFIPLQKP